MAEKLARLVVIGEALTDVIRTGPDTWQTKAGGACWNIARVAARLGLETGFAGAVSRDLFGDELARLSAEAGLNMAYLQRSTSDPFLAIVHETHPPRYFFLGQTAADLDFDFHKLPPTWDTRVEWVHVGSLGLVREPLGTSIVALAERLVGQGVKLSYDPNWRNLMRPDYLKRFEKMLGLADYIKISDEDLSHLLPGLDSTEALAWVLDKAGTATVMYTKGSEGLTLYHQGKAHNLPAFKIPVVDTVGAGDASIGGWIFSMMEYPGRSPLEHARFAAATAACACTRAGAWAPPRSDVESLLEDRS